MSAKTISPKYIVLWRETGERMLDWSFHTTLDLDDSREAIRNLKKDGVRQYSTYKIAEKVDELSSEF
jgi:hypothetical protein